MHVAQDDWSRGMSLPDPFEKPRVRPRFLSDLVRRFAHVFEGCGVGLTVRQLAPLPGAELVPSGAVERPSRLSEVFPAGSRTAAETALELERLQQLKAVLAAYEAHLVMDLAAHRPDAGDPRDGSPGAGVNALSPVPGTSEFFVDELAVVTNSSVRAAGRLAEESYVLVEQLPAVWAALADGELGVPRARVFVEVLASAAAGVADAVVPQVLPEAVGLSLGKLRARLQKAVLAVDEAFAEQLRAAAEAQTDVRLYPTVPGMSELATELPSPVAAACWSTIDELAWMRKNDGDPRPIGHLRALTHAELILRPWDTSRPPVTAVLNVTAPLPSLRPAGPAADSSLTAQEPAEVKGIPITAGHVRELLAQLDAVCPGGLQPPTRGVADGGGHRRRRRPAGHRDPPRAGTHRPARLPRPSGLRRPAAIVRLCGAGPAATDRSIPADPGAAPVSEGAGPHLPPTRLRAAGRPRRPRPRHRPRRRWADRLRQPLLPVPPPPSAQDPRPGLAVRAHRARRAAGDHPERDHPHHPPTGPARPHRATRPARTTPTAGIPGGTTPVLTMRGDFLAAGTVQRLARAAKLDLPSGLGDSWPRAAQQGGSNDRAKV